MRAKIKTSKPATKTLKTVIRKKAAVKSAPPVTSELSEARWAVISSRGCHACGITYSEAENFKSVEKDNSYTICAIEVAAQICTSNHPAVR